jgi:hypothetical protein
MNALKLSQRNADIVRGQRYTRLPFHRGEIDALRINKGPQPVLGALSCDDNAALAWIELQGVQLPVVIEIGNKPLPPPSTDLSPVARALAEMQPATSFRRDLHRALEATHRQQQAQRTLGTHAPVDWRQSAKAQQAQTRSWSLGLVLMGFALIWLLLGRRRS